MGVCEAGLRPPAGLVTPQLPRAACQPTTRWRSRFLEENVQVHQTSS